MTRNSQPVVQCSGPGSGGHRRARVSGLRICRTPGCAAFEGPDTWESLLDTLSVGSASFGGCFRTRCGPSPSPLSCPGPGCRVPCAGQHPKPRAAPPLPWPRPVPTCEKMSTRWPSSRSRLSIFCSSISFPEDRTREPPSYEPLGRTGASCGHSGQLGLGAASARRVPGSSPAQGRVPGFLGARLLSATRGQVQASWSPACQGRVSLSAGVTAAPCGLPRRRPSGPSRRITAHSSQQRSRPRRGWALARPRSLNHIPESRGPSAG